MASTTTSLSRLLTPERILRIQAADKADALRRLVHALAGVYGEEAMDPLFDSVMEREQLLSTGIGLGLAIPHAIVDYVDDYAMALAVLEHGVDFDALDEAPVNILALIVGPQGRKDDYLKVLARTARFLKQHRTDILAADTPAAIHALAEKL